MSYLDRRQLLKMVGGLAVAGVAGSAAGCTSQPEGTQMEQPTGRTITVGLIAPAVGAYGTIGDDITKGLKLFLQEHNNLVGLNNVDLHVMEEGASVDTAVDAAKKLLLLNPVAICGVANPLALGAVAALTEQAQTTLIGAGASPAAFASNQAFTWRAGYVQGEAGRAIAPYAWRNGSRAYVMYEDTLTGREDANAFVDAFTALGGTIVGTPAVGRGNFASRLSSANSANAHTVFAAFTGDDAQQLLGAFREANLGLRLVGPFSLTETTDLSKLGALPARVYTSGFYTPDLDNEDNRRFVSSYHKQYGVQPSSFAMTGYDSISVLDKIIRLVQGDLTNPNINQAASLLGRINSPRGPWAFNVNRTPQQKWYLRRLRLDGQVPANLLDNDLTVLS